MTEDRPISAPAPLSDKRGLPRRHLLRAALFAVSGAAIWATDIVSAVAKMPKKAAGYKSTPKGKQSCSSCTHFQPPSSCVLVAGKISPHGWCRFYVKK